MYSRGNSFTHMVPEVKMRVDYPFKYDLEVHKAEDTNAWLKENEVDAVVDFLPGEDLKEKIRQALILIFPFHRYLNKFSNEYIGSSTADIEFYLKVDQYKYCKESKQKKRLLVSSSIVVVSNFSSEYSFSLVLTEDQLNKAVKENPIKAIAFDTEAEGLNPETDRLVGISFAIQPKDGYYIPIAHTEEFSEFNVNKKVIKQFHEILKDAGKVYLFNARFDMRLMEFSGYNMKDINIIDTQITSWYADSGYKQIKLKKMEKHFLGYYRANLEETLRGLNRANDFNLSMVSPQNLLFYAAQDAISTFELGEITDIFYKEFKLSSKIDHTLLYPLMKMEDHGIRINMEYLEEQLKVILPRLEQLESEIKEEIGDINLNSPKQKAALFKSFGLDTGVKTKKSKEMATGKAEVEAMIKRMEEKGEEIPQWTTKLNERAELEKLQSSFFSSLLEQSKLNNGRVRVNYRNTSTATGRLSSGAEEE